MSGSTSRERRSRSDNAARAERRTSQRTRAPADSPCPAANDRQLRSQRLRDRLATTTGWLRTHVLEYLERHPHISQHLSDILSSDCGRAPASWTDAGHGVCDDHARQMLRQGPPREPLSESGRCAGRLRVFRYAAPLDTGREVLQRQRRELRVEPIRRASSRLFTRFV